VKYVCSIITLFLLISGCRKDQEIITGDITGKVYSYDQYGFPASDQPDVTVKLFGDTALQESAYTDSRGQYLFENRPYGKYSMTLEKEGFIQAWGPYVIYHAGGYSPTLANNYLYEIPTYELHLDSMGYFAEDNILIIYLKLNGDTILPRTYGLNLRVFAGNTAEVSNENYVSSGKAYLHNYGLDNYAQKVPVYGIIFTDDVDQNFEQLKEGTIYIRLYPLAMGQGYRTGDYYPEALGPPSNVISFSWDEVVQGNQ
jgi:hypothetical protein